jgi:anti-anti-sigma factor
MDGGVRMLLLNLRETKIVNSIGISILIEIIEKMMDKGGKIAFCSLTPVIHKTFQIMGLANYASIFENEEAAIAELGL